MRARFTDSIASADFDFSAGTEVLVEGTQFGLGTIPEHIGRQWIASGVLVPIEIEAAALRAPETAARPSAQARRAHPRP